MSPSNTETEIKTFNFLSLGANHILPVILVDNIMNTSQNSLNLNHTYKSREKELSVVLYMHVDRDIKICISRWSFKNDLNFKSLSQS